MSSAKNLKAKPKASPSRIQHNIVNPQAIVNQKVEPNTLQHIAETEDLTLNDLPHGDISVPLNFWLEHKAELIQRPGIVAVQIGSDQEPSDLSDDFDQVSCIVLPFVNHVDGRGYSHAYLLRKRLGFTGQIRAVGDVKFDQVGFLSRAGCDAFELPEGEDYQTALRAFDEFSEFYQPSSDQAQLIFSRRRTVH